jgi:dUTPase
VVATKIVVDEDVFIPQYADSDASCVNLVANLTADHAGIRRVTLPHRATVTIDCGVSIELPTAYRAVVKPTPSLANRGLIVNEGLHIIDKANQGRIQVTVTNVGKEIVVVNHGDQIAQMYIEPVYRFDWVMG